MSIFYPKIIGLKVIEVVKIHDYIQVAFENTVGMSIYASYVVTREGKKTGLYELNGKIVINIEDFKDKIHFSFTQNIRLEISLKSDGRMDPEVLQLSIPGEPIIIFRYDDY